MNICYEILLTGGVGAFFFVLSGIARFCSIGVLDRPLCLALIAGYATSDWFLALSLGLVFELFWLDGVELGSIIPPHGSLGFLLAFPLCRLFALERAEQVLIPLFLSLVATYAAAYHEKRHRFRLDQLDLRLTAWCANQAHGSSPGSLVWVALGRMATCNAMLYLLCFLAICCVLQIWGGQWDWSGMPRISWWMIFLAAFPGAFLSLRTRRAYCMLLGMVGVGFFWAAKIF